ncbi:MAG: TraR/DksA family transcriptional regulator [Spirochaetales bacterium]|nr:TraR/DksA family transcriptional regulator [Spirochaetales bacterium]
MDKDFVTKMESALQKEKEEIIQTLMSEDEDFEALVKDMDPKDLADIAADDIDRSTLEVLTAKDSRRLRLIDSALSRIRNGRYGMCIKCNKKIPEARLEAIPYALMCIECQTSDERRNR